jgi:hypothetical protein
MKFKSEVQLEALNNATVDTDKFLVSDSSTVKYRTGAQVLSDIGGQAALTNPITGTGTTNYLSKFTGTTSLGNSQIFDNGTNVGIGITNPVSKLDLGTSGALRVTQAGITEVYVEGTGVRLKNIYPSGGWARGILTYENSTGTDYFQLGGYGSGQTFIYGYLGASYDNNALRWYPNNNVYVGGNLGVGTSGPSAKLDVNGDGRFQTNLTIGLTTNNNGARTVFNGSTSGRSFQIANNWNVGGSLEITPSTTTAGSTFTTPIFVLNGTTGDVGIGTTSPSTKLEILGTDNSGDRTNPYNVLTVTADNPNNPYGGFGGAILFKNRAYNSGIVNSSRIRSRINNNSIDSSGGSLHFDVTPTAGGSLTQAMMINYNGNVGIGTTNPNDVTVIKTNTDGKGLTIQRNSDSPGTYSQLGFYQSTNDAGTANVWIRGYRETAFADNYMTFGTNSSERIRITSTGNVGIGTTTPYSKFTTLGALSTSTSQISIVNSEGGHTILRTGISGISNAGFSLISADVSGTNQNTRLVVNSAGNVGIGTTSPLSKLHVSDTNGGTIYIQDSDSTSTYSITSISNGGGNLSFDTLNSAGTYVSTDYQIVKDSAGANYQRWFTQGSERLRITSTGNVGIGTTSPGAKLEVLGSGGSVRLNSADSNGSYITFSNNGSATSYIGSAYHLFASPSNIASNLGIRSNNALTISTGGSTPRMHITSTGNVGIGTTSPGSLLHMLGTSPELRIASYDGQTARLGLYEDTTGTQHGGYIQYVGNGDTLRLGIVNSGTSTDVITVTDTFNVGIGTTSPVANLHLRSASSATVMKISNSSSGVGVQDGIDITLGNGFSQLWYYENGYLRIATNNSEKMRITSTGSVGIGTTNPSALLHIGQSNTTSDALMRLGVSYNANRTSRGGITWHDSANVTGKIYTEYDGTMVSMVFGSLYNSGYNSNQLMIIRGNGNVGIGTTSPTYKLHVVGDGYFSGTLIANSVYTTQVCNTSTCNNASVALTSSGVRITRNIADSSAAFDVTQTNASSTGAIQTWRNSAGEKMRVTQSGDVGIGITSPSAKLDVNGDALINGIIVGAGQGNANNNTIIGKNAFGSNSSGEFNVSVGNESLNQADASFNTAIGAQAGNQISTGNGNIVIGSLDMSGNYAPAYDITTEDDYISMGTTSTQEAYINVAWSVLSDARYKTEFNEIPHGLDFVKQLNPISYKLRKNKDTEETIGNKSYGFKAQDILALEGDNPVIINNSKEDRLTYKESNLIPILVKAIQDLSKEVELLKQIINNK